VIVATVRAMKMNGGVAKADLGAENVEAVKKGCANLGRHIENVRQLRRAGGGGDQPLLRHRGRDRGGEGLCRLAGAEAILCKHWAEGSAGIEELAHKVAELAEAAPRNFAPLYPDDMPLFEKIETIAKRIYRADEVIADKSIRDQLKAWEAAGYGHLPVCMAKTQYSFSTDPNLRGAPDRPFGAGARGAAVGRRGLRRGDLRRDHDHARPAQGAGGRGDPADDKLPPTPPRRALLALVARLNATRRCTASSCSCRCRSTSTPTS
jgi:hypothetical protein